MKKEYKIEGVFIEPDGTEYFTYIDQFGRKWKLEITQNESIKFPFVIKPLPLSTTSSS